MSDRRAYSALKRTRTSQDEEDLTQSSLQILGIGIGKGKHGETHSKYGTDPVTKVLDEGAVGLTTRGDITYMGATDLARLAVGAAHSVLKSDGTDPGWLTLSEQQVLGRLTGGNIAGIVLGIGDNNVVQMDDADAASGDFAKFTANGLEGRSSAEMQTDLGFITAVVDDTSPVLGGNLNSDEYDIENIGELKFQEKVGADAQGAGIGQLWVKDDTPNTLHFADDTGGDFKLNRTYGIADDNALEVDGSPNDDEYARFTAAGIEGRTAGEAKTDLGFMTDLADDATPQLGGDLDLNGNAIDFPSTANISDVKDEDDMASDSATMLATQQSIKKYVDDRFTSSQGVLEELTPAEIWYKAATQSSPPQTATISGVSGTTITLSAAVAYKFFSANMTGNCYAKIFNQVRSQYAWVSATPATNQLTVTAAGDISTWVATDTITSAWDGAGGSGATEIDVGPIITAGAFAVVLAISVMDSGGVGQIRAYDPDDISVTIVQQRSQVATQYNFLNAICGISSTGTILIWELATGANTLTTLVKVVGQFVPMSLLL